MHNPMVTGVMMFGRGREQAGVLIELHEDYAWDDPNDDQKLTEFRNKIWYVISALALHPPPDLSSRKGLPSRRPTALRPRLRGSSRR